MSISFSSIKWPRKKKRGRYVNRISIGTKLIRLGEDMRTALSAGPIEASAPERAVYGWLQRFDIPFAYQVPVMGGRRIPGGAVIDFVIYVTNPPIALRVMSYWHTSAIQKEIDDLQKAVLEEDNRFRVEDIWEWETMDWSFMSRRLEQIIFGNLPTGVGTDSPRKAVPPQFDVDPGMYEECCF